MRVESTNTNDVDGEPCLAEHRVLCEELEQLMKVEGLGLYYMRDSIEVSVWTVYAQAIIEISNIVKRHNDCSCESRTLF